jgi:transcriptional repressor NrdR
MVCIHCGSDTKVTNSRPQKRLNQVWRRRECLNCGAIFTTSESAAYEAVWAVKNSKSKLEPFSRDKLFLSLHKSLGHRPTAILDASGLTDTVMRKLATQITDGLIERTQIVVTSQVVLNRFDKSASTHYAAFHRNS